MWELSPSVWAAAKSPRSAVDTLRSLIWCRSPSRTTCTRRTSALPYWLVPKVMAMADFLLMGGDTELSAQRWRQPSQAGAVSGALGRLGRGAAGVSQRGAKLRRGQHLQEPPGQRLPGRRGGGPVHPQPGHAAVRIDVKPD